MAVNGVTQQEVYSITGDEAENLWLSGNRGLSHYAGWAIWLNIFPGRLWDVANKLRSLVSDQAEFGFHSGPTAACCISRMVRSARRTPPLMGWVRAMSRSSTRSAKGRVWAGTGGRPQPHQRRPHRYAHYEEWIAVRHHSLVDRRRRSFVLVVHGLWPGTHHADRTGCVDRRPEAHGFKRRFGTQRTV